MTSKRFLRSLRLGVLVLGSLLPVACSGSGSEAGSDTSAPSASSSSTVDSSGVDDGTVLEGFGLIARVRSDDRSVLIDVWDDDEDSFVHKGVGADTDLSVYIYGGVPPVGVVIVPTGSDVVVDEGSDSEVQEPVPCGSNACTLVSLVGAPGSIDELTVSYDGKTRVLPITVPQPGDSALASTEA